MSDHDEHGGEHGGGDAGHHTVHTALDWFGMNEGKNAVLEAVLHGGLRQSAGEVAKHATKHAGQGAGFMGNLGAAMGPLSVLAGITEMAEASGQKGADRTVGMLRGGMSVAGGAATSIASLSAAMGGGGALAGAAAAAAPVIGAAGAGLMGGQKIAQHLDKNSGDGTFGQDELGRNLDVFDWASRKGHAVDEAISGKDDSGPVGWLRSKLGGVAGAAVSGGASIVGATKFLGKEAGVGTLAAVAAASPLGLAALAGGKLWNALSGGSDAKPSGSAADTSGKDWCD